MASRARSMPVEVGGDGRFVVPARERVPAYVATYESGRLREKVDEALEALRACRLCPRDCEVDRLANRFAVCKSGRHARVASAFPHFGEEDVLRGEHGSGTIFFGWCNLRCVFCFAPDVRVLTDQGMRRIEDIFALGTDGVRRDGGDVRFLHGLNVWTREGRLAPVVKAFRHRYRGEMVVIKPYGLPPLVATPDHRIFVAREPGGPVRGVAAGSLGLSDFLVVPKPRSRENSVELDVRALLGSHVGTFRRSMQRRVPLSRVRAVALGGAGQRLTSRQIGDRLGYHPAYVRTLLSRMRRGRCSDTDNLPNDLVEHEGRIRFKTEKGDGVPARLSLDADLACLLGYYCAEGHVTAGWRRPNAHRLVFSYGAKETGLFERTATLIKRVFGVEASIQQRRTAVAVEVGSTSLALLFATLCGRGSRHKRVPSALLTAPVDVCRAFLKAYWDGDGCQQPRYMAANTVSEELALGLVALLLWVGLFPYLCATRRQGHYTIEGRRVCQSAILYYVKCRRDAWDGAPSTDTTRTREMADAFWVPVREISRCQYDGPVYNLEVTGPDHSYTASGVAVANCQNFETSQEGEGVDVTAQDLARLMLRLQAQGCHNINFVTPEHVVPQILEALLPAIEGGLRLPLVYNTSAYDSPHALALMQDVVDVYMPDFKLWDRERSRRYLLAPDYPEAAREAIGRMHAQVGVLHVTEDGLAARGVLVRHLVMPGLLDDTRAIAGYLAGLSPDTYVNVMDQYAPAHRVGRDEKFAGIDRRVSRREMAEAVAAARDAGLWRLDARWAPRALQLWA